MAREKRLGLETGSNFTFAKPPGAAVSFR